MICVPHNPVLLISPADGIDAGETGHANEPWLCVRVESVGDALRQVRLHKPRVLVLDLSTFGGRGSEIDTSLRMIYEVRRRVPKLPIVVFGAGDDASMEEAVRSQGVTVYLPVSDEVGHREARRHIQRMHPRDGPNHAHGPPASGVPPR
jgi:DNA-binding NarL/FixJ family response regulator